MCDTNAALHRTTFCLLRDEKKKVVKREEIAKRWTERSGDFLIKRAGIRPLWRHVDQHIYYAHSEGPKGGIGIHNYLYL